MGVTRLKLVFLYLFLILMILNFCMFEFITPTITFIGLSGPICYVFIRLQPLSAKAVNGGDWVESCIFVLMYFRIFISRDFELL